MSLAIIVPEVCPKGRAGLALLCLPLLVWGDVCPWGEPGVAGQLWLRLLDVFGLVACKKPCRRQA